MSASLKTGAVQNADGTAGRRELLAWALYDFANSGYTTVVLTTIFSAYFVAIVAGEAPDLSPGAATLLWTLAVGSANLAVLISAPAVGAIADHRAMKKRFLLLTTIGCVVSTALLSLVGPGELALGMTLFIASAISFSSGENLIAAFLPEIAPRRKMGRISGYGWILFLAVSGRWASIRQCRELRICWRHQSV